MIKFITNPEARDRVIEKIDAAKKLLNMAPGTKGRLPISFGIPSMNGVPQTAISVDQDHIWRFYDHGKTEGTLVHEQLGSEALSEWVRNQAEKFAQASH